MITFSTSTLTSVVPTTVPASTVTVAGALTSTLTSVIPTTVPASTVTQTPPTTLFVPDGSTIYYNYQTGLIAIHSASGTTRLFGGFSLYVPVTGTAPVSTVNVNNYISALGGLPTQAQKRALSTLQSGQVISARAGSFSTAPVYDFPASSVNTQLNQIALSSGDLLLLPIVTPLATSVDLTTQFRQLASATQFSSMTTSTTTPTPTPTPTPPPPADNHVGAIAGGVVGGVLGIVIIVIVAILLWRRQRARRERDAVPVLSQMGQPGSPSYETRQNIRRSGAHSGAW